MNFELQGKLINKGDISQVTDTFKKREFVIEVENERNPDWNDFIKFQLTQDRCDLIESVNLNDNLKVTFAIRGRRWEKDGQVNYFSNLEAWKVEKIVFQSTGEQPQTQQNAVSQNATQTTPQETAPPNEEDDDLPF